MIYSESVTVTVGRTHRRYDNKFWTLMEIVPSNVHANGKDPYDMCEKKGRHPADSTRIGNLWKTNQKNTAARYRCVFCFFDNFF